MNTKIKIKIKKLTKKVWKSKKKRKKEKRKRSREYRLRWRLCTIESVRIVGHCPLYLLWVRTYMRLNWTALYEMNTLLKKTQRGDRLSRAANIRRKSCLYYVWMNFALAVTAFISPYILLTNMTIWREKTNGKKQAENFKPL